MIRLGKLSELSKSGKLSLIYLTCLIGLLAFALASAQSAGNASLSLQKDLRSGLFTINLRDSQGIRSFSFVFPTDTLPYNGELSGCPQSRKLTNVTFRDPGDFTPKIAAVIADCQGGETEFEIFSPDEKGGVEVKKAGLPPPPPPPPPLPSVVPPGRDEGVAAPAPTPATEPLKEISYPVPQLGNCESEAACHAYCDSSKNIESCLAFAEEKGLLTKAEIERGKKFAEIVKTGGGPGGCKTEAECRNYCNDVDRLDECVKFAEDNGFVEGQELEEMKKVHAVVKSGKSLPGGCKNRSSCELYCKTPEHFDECIAFAKEAGFMSEEEIKEAEKFLPLLKSGQTPGGCKSKEECEAFCEAENNFEECFNFAEKAGLIGEKEREIMKKTGGKGPGGCKGRACQTFCENPANEQACFDFAKEYGLISEEDLSRMEEGKRLLREQLENGPPEIQECLKSVIGVPGLDLESPSFIAGPELGEKMRECFEKLIPEGARGQFEFGPGGEFSGPGGCQSREECEAYCKDNPEACGFGGAQGGFSGPGGCKSQEECQAYCEANPDACKDFQPPSGGESPGGPGGIRGIPGGFPSGPGGKFPVPPGGGIPSGASYVGPGGCATPEACIRYCHEEGHRAECDAFKTPATTPYAEGSGPGGCGSVEKCNAYCKTHEEECDAFISEKTPSEVRCQSGFETKTDNKGNKYCSPISCPEGQAFYTDVLGRQACSPIGAGQLQQQQPPSFPSGTAPPPTTDYQQQYEQQYQQQYQQQYPSRPPGAVFEALMRLMGK